MSFVTFMSSPAGRGLRIVAGAVLIVAGVIAQGAWYVLIPIGLVPLAAGVFDFCLFAPLAKLPFAGRAVRERTARL